MGRGSFRRIDELAERCGHYCWLENRLFVLTGERATFPGTGPTGVASEVRVFFSEMSRRHAFLAAQWSERLPVRAGVDPDALVVPPPGQVGEALDRLQTEPELVFVLVGLVEQVLPRLLDTYGDHLLQAPPVSEAPVRAVLELARLLEAQELRDGRALLKRGSLPAREAGGAGDLGSLLEGVFGPGDGIFPAARAS